MKIPLFEITIDEYKQGEDLCIIWHSIMMFLEYPLEFLVYNYDFLKKTLLSLGIYYKIEDEISKLNEI